MPLASPEQQIDLSLLEKTRGIARDLNNAVQRANSQVVDDLLSKTNEELTAWLQGKAPELNTLLTRHAVTGAGLNAAIAAVQATLTEAGDKMVIPTVDVRPLQEKLADQGRQVDFTTLTVTNIPVPIPEPEPEPEPEPAPEPEPEP